VVRALFDDRLYFRFNPERFFPNSEEQVERISAQRDAEARRARIIEEGASGCGGGREKRPGGAPAADAARRGPDVLKSFYLFEKESRSTV